MTAKKPDVSIIIKPEAEFDQARRDIATKFDSAEKIAKAAVADMEKAVARAKLSPNVDLSNLDQTESTYKTFATQLSERDLDIQINNDNLRKTFDLTTKLKNTTIVTGKQIGRAHV